MHMSIQAAMFVALTFVVAASSRQVLPQQTARSGGGHVASEHASLLMRPPTRYRRSGAGRLRIERYRRSEIPTTTTMKRRRMTTAASASKYEWFEPVTKFELREEQHYNGGTHADKAGLPLLICVPGIDGSGLTAVAQFAELSQQFELRCLSFDHADRSTFDDIRKAVTMQVKQAKSEGRTVFVLGESFGGIVALSLGIGDSNDNKDDRESKPDRLILINSASSFPRTFLGRISEQLIRVPEPFFSLALLPLPFMILDVEMFSNIAKAARDEYPPILQSMERKAFVARIYPKLLQKLTLRSDDLKWRVENWVLDGCGKVNSRLNEIQVPVLAVAGTSDLLLPSKEEAFRFSREIPQCKVNLVEGAGHAGVLDQRVDLTKIITGWIGSEMRTVATEKI